MACARVVVLVLIAACGRHRALGTAGPDAEAVTDAMAIAMDGATSPADADAGEALRADINATIDAALACGDAGQRPCPGAVCNRNDCIGENGLCVAAPGPCGPTSGRCNGFGQGCFDDQASSCGRVGQPCCGTRSPHGLFCSESGRTCVERNGSHACVPCGRPGELCCAPDDSCRSGACTPTDAGRACP
jgi:hypothetical protein